MTDDIIRSMKEQMVPSDDVVSDLLAKIAAFEASPETIDNVDSFENFRKADDIAAAVVSEKKASKAKKFTTKSIWYYGTAAAASVIVLLSVFSILGGSDPADIKNAVDGIIDNPNVVVTPDDNTDSDPSQNPDGDKTVTDNDKEDDKDNDNEKGSFWSNLFNKDDKGDDSDTQSGSNSNQGDGNDSNNQPSDNNNSTSGDPNVVTPLTPPASDDPGNSNIVTPPEGDDSKVTPGAPGEADISWDREILAENTVSNITISGTNYVVESVTASSSVASTEVKTISLEIPATSTTNHTTVKAKVKKVKNVSEELMVAVDANGFKDTLLYTNKDYTPSSLGQFIADAGLTGNTSFAKAVYCKGERIGYSSYQRFNVDGVDALVSKYIFSCEKAGLSDYSSYRNGNVHVLFKSSKNPTCSVIDFGVSDNGYLYVKMASGNSFTFHIGEKNANGFINSVTGA